MNKAEFLAQISEKASNLPDIPMMTRPPCYEIAADTAKVLEVLQGIL